MKITINDIAKECGVSKTTVSRYINNSGYVSSEVAKKIEKAINDMNYIPSATARALSTKKSNVVGVLVPEAQNPFFGEVFKGISEIAEREDYRIIYFHSDNNSKKELKALQTLRSYDICGLIITPSSSDKKEDGYEGKFKKAINELNIPVVLFDRNLKDENYPGVFTDNKYGAYVGTSILLKNGHKRIATITGDKNLEIANERLAGFVDACKEYSVKDTDRIILNGDFTKNTAYMKTKELLSKVNIPIAIFSPNNMTTIGILKAIREKALNIPNDVALVGFDDIEILNDLNIKITVLRRNTVRMGEKCMELLIETIEEKVSENKKIMIKPDLIIRGSEK